MQSSVKAVFHQSILLRNFQTQRLLKSYAQSNFIKYQPRIDIVSNFPQRYFSTGQTLEVKNYQANQTVDINAIRKKQGIDMTFSDKKHAYVLTFPWNFPEIIQDFEQDYRSLSNASYWTRFLNNTNTINEANELYRQFHQYCAIPDYKGIDHICEGQLSEYVKESLKRIRFHGLGIEMANLTVRQPKIRVLKAEIHHGLNVQRKQNAPNRSSYSIKQTKFMGANNSVYAHQSAEGDLRQVWDHLDSKHKPYLVALTLLVESPMKLYVQNQNYSSILFGANDEEQVKNVIRIEANMKWADLYKILPVGNKPTIGWRITDFNNVLNENPYFRD